MKSILLSLFLLCSWGLSAQCSISGIVKTEDTAVEMAHVYIEEISAGTYTNASGYFKLEGLEYGEYHISISYLGYFAQRNPIEINEESCQQDLSIALVSKNLNLDEVIVTGTRTEKTLKNSPILASVLNASTLENVQACSMSEGLKFQPGLRVETDCQTCNYTQLRMNGLAGGYSQILINGRPVFSPLTGLYGLEQLPVNIVERVEVIRGGGSSLYGSSAIGGTVNIITKTPKENEFSISSLYQNINSESDEFILSANAAILNRKKNGGMSAYFNKRDREFYDHNSDGFSELPELDGLAAGIGFFLLPTENQKLEVALNYLNEYRFGGEMKDTLAQFAQQAEERDQDVFIANVDYQINMAKSALILYGAFQRTERTHFTGILPDEPEEIIDYQNNPPFGESLAHTIQVGAQWDKKLKDFPLGQNTFSIGLEYLNDDILDEISAYSFLIDQRSEDLGLFIQNDWNFAKGATFLGGLRLDKHNLLDDVLLSPRLALLFKPKSNLRLRASYGTGFRAPQAFDADLHIAFAGGGVSRVVLSPELREERSQSYSLSVDWDKALEKMVYGFTLEAFHNSLNDAFALDPIGQDSLGEVFVKRNAQEATVQGLTLESRLNFNAKVQLESGFTVQKSFFSQPITYIDGLAGTPDFIRTPNLYGFANLNFMPSERFSANLNFVHTGSMLVPHFAGAENQLVDEMLESKSFNNVSTKVGYAFKVKNNFSLDISGGVKNIFNSYQDDFDIGKNRDSNFIYGPAQARTYFLQLKLDWR
ncbi:MAG: TonB-dependent receptor [Bacteroidota bacterium]